MGPFSRVPPSQLRVSDAERHEVAESLSRHFADGRLDDAELDERAGRAMAAKTRADLAGLLADLPAPETAPAPPSAAGPPPRRHPLALAAGYLLLRMVALSYLRQSLLFHGVGLAPHGFLLVLVATAVFHVRRGRRREHDRIGSG